MATASVGYQQPFDTSRMDESFRENPPGEDQDDCVPGTFGPYKVPRTPTTPKYERERKIGHRRVDGSGQVTYKKKPTSELMTAMQLGIGQSITSLSAKPKRDLLLQDFSIVETVFFPREGSNLTPAHHYSDFRFKTYAPIAFRYFRELFSIQPDDFLLSMCNEAMQELSNPGASGSIFYISADDEFIIKTVQHKEAEFLQKLLPGYYMNLNQNLRTLLPKFYGLYCYQCGGKNIRFVVMNNLLPLSIKMHEKYDLKGSTYKRKASKQERLKKVPTLKDLDFKENHPEGIMLESDTYNAVFKTIERDCRVLQSFKIMDYSMLIGIYNLDQAAKEKEQKLRSAGAPEYQYYPPGSPDDTKGVARGRSVRQRVAQYSTAMEAIHARADPLELNDDDIPAGGIPARNSRGERLLLFLGLIDILQNYRLKKKIEHAMKAIVIDGDTISVHRPGFYASRFEDFFRENVFKKITSSLKQSPSKKKPQMTRLRSLTAEGKNMEPMTDPRSYTLPRDLELAAVGGRPDLLPENATPPRLSVDSAIHHSYQERSPISYISNLQTTRPSLVTTSPSYTSVGNEESAESHGIFDKPPSSPVYSYSESTPTHTEHTEGTPSFTTSSASCSSDMLDSTPVLTSRSSRHAEVSLDQMEFEIRETSPHSPKMVSLSRHSAEGSSSGLSAKPQQERHSSEFGSMGGAAGFSRGHKSPVTTMDSSHSQSSQQPSAQTEDDSPVEEVTYF